MTDGQVARALRMGRGNAEQFFEFSTAALGAGGLLAATDKQLELGGALRATVFVEGHGVSSGALLVFRFQFSVFRLRTADFILIATRAIGQYRECSFFKSHPGSGGGSQGD